MRSLALVLVLLWSAAAHATDKVIQALIDSGDLEVSVALDGFDNPVAGGRIDYVVRLSTSRWFTGGARFDTLEVPGAVVLTANAFATSYSDPGRPGWSGQEWRIPIFKRDAGILSVGETSLRINVAGSNGLPVKGSVTLPPVAMEIGSTGVEDALVATGLTVTQSLEGTTDGLQPGDAVIRYIRIQSNDAPDMFIPPAEAGEIEGLSLYQADPVLQFRLTRGKMTGTRVEKFTYLVEREGTFEIPAYEYEWYDRNTGETRTEVAPGFTLVASGTGAAVADEATPVDPLKIAIWVGGGLAGLLVGWILIRLVRWLDRIVRRVAAARAARPEPLKSVERRYYAAASAGEARTAVQAMYEWIDRQHPGQQLSALLGEAAIELRPVITAMFGQHEVSPAPEDMRRLGDLVFSSKHSPSVNSPTSRQPLW